MVGRGFHPWQGYTTVTTVLPACHSVFRVGLDSFGMDHPMIPVCGTADATTPSGHDGSNAENIFHWDFYL